MCRGGDEHKVDNATTPVIESSREIKRKSGASRSWICCVTCNSERKSSGCVRLGATHMKHENDEMILPSESSSVLFFF